MSMAGHGRLAPPSYNEGMVARQVRNECDIHLVPFEREEGCRYCLRFLEDPPNVSALSLEIRLEELSVAEVGQHPGAKVLAVRAEDGTPRLDALRRRLATLPNW